MNALIAFHFDDPTIFAKCGGKCCRTGRGSVTARIFYRAYSRREWNLGATCDNCKSAMVVLYEIESTAKARWRPSR